MKRCPTCNRTFDDPTLAFCTADGTPLVADAPAYQQPPPPPPQQPQYQPAGQQFYPQQQPPQMSFGQQPAGRRAGFAKTAFILGLISLVLFVVASLSMWRFWSSFRYSPTMPTVIEFWATLIIGFLLLLLAMLLGLIGLIQSFRNPARYGGKALAFLGPFLGVLAAVITLSVFSYARLKAPSQVYTYNYNTNTYSNSNTYSSNSNTYSSNSNASKQSSSAMTDDERYKLFFAASKSGDKQLALRVFQKIGIVDQSGMPTSEYKSFLAGSFAWALKNTDFIQTIPTADKARDYVNSHM
ncbi:MAG: hypothetical protein M3348_14415 [Acidobacteriota bacterium]|nr:hypothetical protein [Acidobacteriota bacterium]